jgi:hypothetical protein
MATTDDPFNVNAAIVAHNMRAAGLTDDDDDADTTLSTGGDLWRQRMWNFQQEVWYRQAGFTVPPKPTVPAPLPSTQLALPLKP